jgi:hypothetical protein
LIISILFTKRIQSWPGRASGAIEQSIQRRVFQVGGIGREAFTINVVTNVQRQWDPFWLYVFFSTSFALFSVF